MTIIDLTRYRHLYRVRTVLQLITPPLKKGIAVSLRALVVELRNEVDHDWARRLHGGQFGARVSRAVKNSRFGTMTDEEICHVIEDVGLCMRRYYGERSRMWRDCSD